MEATEHLDRGRAHYEANEFDDACAEFSRAIELAPGFPDPYTGRGYVHYLNGDYERAISDFSEAIRLNPRDADAWAGRADSRQIIGRFETCRVRETHPMTVCRFNWCVSRSLRAGAFHAPYALRALAAELSRLLSSLSFPRPAARGARRAARLRLPGRRGSGWAHSRLGSRRSSCRCTWGPRRRRRP